MESGTEKKYIEAGKISAKILELIKKAVKPGMPFLEIADRIEGRIIELGAKPAFPVDISCSEIAAHYSPFWQDKGIAEGLAKIDFGISIDGYIVDSAVSLDLTDEQEHSALIKAAEDSLAAAIRVARKNIAAREIGREIHKVITSSRFSPVRNLSGHELEQYNVHAGLTIPNYDNGNETKLQEGAFAIEPFATAGIGIVQDGKPSGIYKLELKKNVRDSKTREILKFIEAEYKTLPFAERWLARKFGSRALFSLQMLEQQGILHQFPYLVEKTRMPVSQAEKTILIKKDRVIVLGGD